MLTRGKLLGDILDGLGQLSFVLQTRSNLGLFDLNKYCEDFIKDFLNLIYGYNLVNLNAMRSNEPGLDLGDAVKKLGIQVTTDKRSYKINNTLEKITEEQKARYERFIVFILGSKQSSYSGIDSALASGLQFEVDKDIWDFGDVERDVITLPLEKIKLLYELLQSNLIRLFSDLETGTTPSGEQTTMLSRLERRPVPFYDGCGSLVAYINQKYEGNLTIQELDEAFQNFYSHLAELPKITREFFYALLSRSEYIESMDSIGTREILIKRVLSISEMRFEEELKLLNAYDIGDRYEVHEDEYWILFRGICKNEHCLWNLIEYVEDNNLDLKPIIVDLNFSCLT